MVQVKAWGQKDVAKAIECGDYGSSFIGLLNRVINRMNAIPSCSPGRAFTIKEESPDSNTYYVQGESWAFRIVKYTSIWYAIEK